jgi:hypothetical protein
LSKPPSESPGASPGKWQYSLKSLLIVATGVCVWAKIAGVLYGAYDGPIWLKVLFLVWLGALLAQGGLCAWAWRQIHLWKDSAFEVPYGRFRVAVAWGIVPASLWLVVGIAGFEPRNTPDLYSLLGVTVLHIALPTALLVVNFRNNVRVRLRPAFGW